MEALRYRIAKTVVFIRVDSMVAKLYFMFII